MTFLFSSSRNFVVGFFKVWTALQTVLADCFVKGLIGAVLNLWLAESLDIVNFSSLSLFLLYHSEAA